MEPARRSESKIVCARSALVVAPSPPPLVLSPRAAPAYSIALALVSGACWQAHSCAREPPALGFKRACCLPPTGALGGPRLLRLQGLQAAVHLRARAAWRLALQGAPLNPPRAARDDAASQLSSARRSLARSMVDPMALPYALRLALLLPTCLLAADILWSGRRLKPGLQRALAAVPALALFASAPLLFRRPDSGACNDIVTLGEAPALLQCGAVLCRAQRASTTRLSRLCAFSHSLLQCWLNSRSPLWPRSKRPPG